MITLNLIPTQKKNDLRLANFYIVVKNLIISILIIITTVAIVLLVSKIILQNMFNEIVAQSTLTTRYGNIFSGEIKIFNERLNGVKKIQGEYISWSKFISDFAKLVPTDIIVSNLVLSISEKDGNKIIISGLAKDREKLLNFKDNLEDSSLFDNVNVPLENLLKKEEINFSLKADINKQEIKQ